MRLIISLNLGALPRTRYKRQGSSVGWSACVINMRTGVRISPLLLFYGRRLSGELNEEFLIIVRRGFITSDFTAGLALMKEDEFAGFNNDTNGFH